ncbi:hypothetical protein EC991762_4571 [Escherichia coli 99.1762]|nr:hypothetical protein EC991762_4571 [Escherichia coli 99.1762]
MTADLTKICMASMTFGRNIEATGSDNWQQRQIKIVNFHIQL